MNVDAIDLFCGAGGLSYGLKKAGVSIRAGIDLDPKCEYPYRANLPEAEFFLRDITKIEANELAKLYRKDSYKLLAGCAPCQPFSTLRNGIDRRSSDKWPLLAQFSRLVREMNPDIVTMENVPMLETESIFSEFVASLIEQGFKVSAGVVDAANYGVPQRRKRLVLLASKYEAIHLLSAEEMGVKRKSVRDAIGNLPEISSGETSVTDPLHKARALTEINLKRIKASSPGGTWEDWPEHLKLKCHTKASGASYKSVYGRMEWDKASGTITTQSTNFGTGRFGHPTQDRGLSLREMAILQSFPEDYKFAKEGEKIEFSPMGRLIGNAVPVDLGYAVGLSVVHHLKNIGDLRAKQTSI